MAIAVLPPNDNFENKNFINTFIMSQKQSQSLFLNFFENDLSPVGFEVADGLMTGFKASFYN